jgi:hypothetical protein
MVYAFKVCQWVFKTLSRIFGWGIILGRGTYWWSSFHGKRLGCFGHFILMCNSSAFLSHTNSSFFFFLISFVQFQQESYASMWGHYGSRIMIVFLRPLSKVSSLTIDILWWYRLSFYGGLCPHLFFIGNWVVVAPYLCSRFHIFYKPILEEYVFQVEGGPHLL